MTAAARSPRHVLLGQVHAIATANGLDEDARRDKLEGLTGKRSAKDCSDDELRAFLKLFHAKQNPNKSYTGLTRALWISAYNLGLLDSGSDAALDAFVERQTGKANTKFLTSADSNKVTEALKAICARGGFVVPADGQGGLKARRALVAAQWQRMGELGLLRVVDPKGWDSALDAYVSKVYLTCTGSVVNMTVQHLDACQRAFGFKIRKGQRGKVTAP